MVKNQVTIQNKSGFHLRPAQLFMEKANEFKSKISVYNEAGMGTDAKSILGLMTMGFEYNTNITIEAEGEDEESAVSELTKLVESKFGED